MLIFAQSENKFIITSHESKYSLVASGGPAVTAADIQFLELGDSLHRDERGFAYFPFQNLPDSLPKPEMCGNCHLISIEPGHLRGQHRHPGKTEWLLLFHGMGQFYWRTTGDGQVHQRLLSGLQTLVVIPPGIPHTLRNDGPHALYLLAWRAAVPAAGDAPDTIPEYVI
jgi:dTDP-4-dehydrorhamnose 3,5-epimerase-like enzyme